MHQLTIPLKDHTEIPLYEQIYEHIKEEMKAGTIPAYSRLPSTRKLSEGLGVSRATVQKAYDQLLAEGYLDAEPCRGYYTAQLDRILLEEDLKGRLSLLQQADPGMADPRVADQSKPYQQMSELQMTDKKTIDRKMTDRKMTVQKWICDFSPGGVDLTAFPYPTWRRLMKETMMDETGSLFLKGDPQGEPGLRKTIAEYIHEARGVKCRPEQIVIGAGSEYILVLLSMIFGRDTSIAMEDPTYLQAYRVLASQGHKIVPVAMDSMGMRTDLLRRTGVRLAYCMPSHQYPTGTVMPISRRLELLAWAKEYGAFLIEDDYDSEFRYSGRPIPALRSVDHEERVIYLGTFSRAIAPAIRVSFMVLPEQLLLEYQRRCGFFSCTVPRADQAILERYLSGGHFERHLGRMRGIYREKRQMLLELLEGLGPEYTVQGDAAGVHILVCAHGRLTEAELVSRAAAQGVRVYGMSECRIGSGQQGYTDPCVILGFAGISIGEIQKGVAGLIRAWTDPSVV